MALDKGLFAQQHLAVQVVVHSGSSQVIIPELVRGDVDIAGISANPGFFNQFAQGFDAKIIASSSSGLAPAIIGAIPTPPYTGEYGTIHTGSLEVVQRFWHTFGLVPTEQTAGVTVPPHPR